MSTYADFKPISKVYDDSRLPIGVMHYLGLAYSFLGKTAENLTLLDAGCGTGTHTEYLLNHGLGSATLMDAEEAMLEKARQKLKPYVENGKVTIENGRLPKLSYPDSKFDIVMMNQVLHHLVDLETDKEMSIIKEAIKESYRVLKPNGLIICTQCTPNQVRNAFWFAKVFPKTFEKSALRFPEPDKLIDIFQQCGFKSSGMLTKPTDTVFPDDYYFTATGPLDEEWRHSNSVTANIDEDELPKSLEMMKEMQKAGKLREFMLESDSMRKHIGQYGLFYGVKPL